MQCEMCGTDTELVKARVEGTELNICKDCAKFGKIIPKPRPVQRFERTRQAMPSSPNKEIVQYIVSDYASKVKAGREKKGLKQEELGKMMAERESLIHKIESGHFKPGIELARKLEKYLHITLIEQHEEIRGAQKEETKSGAFTLGDMAKLKKK